jgi:6-phosphogluconolactonase/glucosamine-6-phosphate isomerase/deaminase
MDIKTGENPAEDLAADLSTWILSQTTEKIVCFCAGGSALRVFYYITDDNVKRRTIFMMGDERVSRDPNVNNHEQLKTQLGATYNSFTIVDTSYFDDTEAAYIDRLNAQVKIFLQEKYRVIFILGLGEDGHTAGIFPLTKESFEETYLDEGIYVPVHIESLTIDSRASLTPAFIQSHVEAIFAYATGEKKRAVIERLREASNSTPVNELPASIVKNHPQTALYTDITP